MCGIAGLLDIRGSDVSASLLAMLGNIQHRGPDASGISVYGCGEALLLRVAAAKNQSADLLRSMVSEYASITDEQINTKSKQVNFIEMALEMDQKQVPILHAAINNCLGFAVHSFARGARVYKEGGLLKNLTGIHEIAHVQTATHGIGHVRMATESAEDINAAHPFVSPFYPELSIVHNGQFTNYYNMRRFLETRGAVFKTLNDSEAASHLIAYRMRENNGDLEDALRFAGEKMDGIFCILAATQTQIGFVKDKLGIKPLLLAESADRVMFGSEQIEFTALGEDIYAEEMEPGEVRVWNV